MGKLSGVADVKNTLRGTSAEDAIVGGNLADRLYGNAGADILRGGAGNDYIHGGAGENEFWGGTGNDILVSSGKNGDTYTIETGDGNDTIRDAGSSDADLGDFLNVNFLTSATSGVFIKRGNDLIVAEGTENLTGDADGDGNDAEDLATELAGIQGLADLSARKAAMKSILSNLTTSVTIKNHFSSGEMEWIRAVGSATVHTQTVSTNLVDYNTGLKYFNQAVTNPNIVKGTDAADVIVASANGQILKGGKGGDTYYIDGKTDVIIEDTGSPGGFLGDTVVFDDNSGGAGGTYTYTKEGNNVRITFDDGSGGDIDASVIIKNFYINTDFQVEATGCDVDGDLSAGVANDAFSFPGFNVASKIAAITSTTKVLRGSVVDEKLDLAATGQTAYGYAGNDEYTVTAGKAVIVDSAGTQDVLNADHLATENDGVYIRRGNDLIIVDGGDAVEGFATADDAVTAILGGGAAYDTPWERRKVVNNLLKMTDSITVKNYFTSGTIESIKALNNTSISLTEILTTAIDYRTGLLVTDNGAGNARINGTAGMDYITATLDNQKLYGGNSNDIYVIPGGVTGVEIRDTNGYDIVKFSDADLDGADSYELDRIGNDLIIRVTDAGEGDSSVIIKNHYLRDNYNLEKMEDNDAGVKIYPYDKHVYGSSGDDVLTSKVENDGNYFYGQAGNDSIYATAQNDRLYGDDGDDTLCAAGHGGYNDYLYGGEGNDVYEILPGDSNDAITEVDATSDDTDKVVFKGTDFSSASTALTLTRSGNTLKFTVDTSDGITTYAKVSSYYAGGTSQIEIIEDDYGNAYNLVTNTVSGTFNAAITFAGDNNANTYIAPTNAGGLTITSGSADDILVGSSGGDTIQGGGGADSLIGDHGNDSIEGGDGGDIISGGDGDDWIDAGAGNDSTVQGGDGDDTIQGGLGNDALNGNNDNDVFLYDLDSGNAAGADTINDFTIGEDVIRFTTGANNQLGNFFRNEIAIAHSTPGATDNLLIGYNWDEAAQDYTNSITVSNWDDSAGAVAADVIEFVTSEGTVALSHQDIIDIIDATQADDDAPTTLAGVHDDGNDNGGVLLGTIAGLWS